jgi:hypothetical protein
MRGGREAVMERREGGCSMPGPYKVIGTGAQGKI